MSKSNEIGVRGESIFSSRISKGLLLVPSFLGDKYNAVDFIVNLSNCPRQKAFFFVSVKTTNRPKYTSKLRRLRISVTRKQLSSLKKIRIPVYIVGVDATTEVGYIISASRLKKKSLNSIPTAFPITHLENIKMLWEEVKAFWDNSKDAFIHFKF